MALLTPHPIDLSALVASVTDPSCGAVLTFLGTTRAHFEGRPVLRLEYEAHSALAERELAAICAEVAEGWPGARCALQHRLGLVPLGEVSVAIAVAAPHREAAYAASRHAIEALKARVPIFKREVYADGSTWKANTPSPELPR
jgi:MoaE-MoaD fusion protein